MKNKYCIRSRISEQKIRDLVRCFAVDLTALQTAQLTGLNRNTVNRFYHGLRERIYAACEAQRPMFGVVEVDESLFGPRHVKGNRGRGAYGKTTVFGIFERMGRFTRKLSLIAQKPYYKALYAEEWILLPS